MELVVAPDVVAVVCDWLRAQLAAELSYSSPIVGSRVPEERPALFATVARTGGPLRDHVVDEAQVTVDCWGATAEDAHDLAQHCRALMHAAAGRIVGGVQVYTVIELAGPGYLPDPESGQDRYRCSYQVTVRCAVTP